MRAFRKFIAESIVDPERETISPDIFFAPESDNPKLKPKVIEQIDVGIKKLQDLTTVKDYMLMGSILTRRYNEEADLDVTVLVDASDEELKSVRKQLKNINGSFVPGTRHPVNYFVTNDVEDYKRKRSLADGEFDIKKNEFIRKPIHKPFDVKKYWTEFEIAAGGIDVAKGELKRDLIDYEQLKTMSRAQVKYLRKQIEDKLEDVEEITKELADLYEKIKQDRRDAFDRPITPEDIKQYGDKNRLPENVIYKLLEKYHYINFLHKVDEILGPDKELSPDEADELADLVLRND